MAERDRSKEVADRVVEHLQSLGIESLLKILRELESESEQVALQALCVFKALDLLGYKFSFENERGPSYRTERYRGSERVSSMPRKRRR